MKSYIIKIEFEKSLGSVFLTHTSMILESIDTKNIDRVYRGVL